MIDNSNWKLTDHWPRKGDQLFNGDDDWWNKACLNNWPPSKWGLYAEGYRRAGDLLVEYIKDKHIEQDILVYPIVFSYRQYIELELKEIIVDGNKLLGKSEGFPKKCHNLEKLWTKCMKILEELEGGAPADDLDAMEELIHQFSKVDPTSQAFRYSKDKNDEPFLKDLKEIKLGKLKETMAGIACFLDGALAYIFEALQNMPDLPTFF